MFSVVIPVFNHKAFVEEAVKSAVGDGLVHEILLVDDLSSDGSAELIAEFPHRYGRKVRILDEAQKSNRGAHERLNQLCEAAAGPWISILNSDDIYTQGRFEIARRLAAGGCNFITGALLLIDGDGGVIRGKSGNLDPDYPLPRGLENADLNAELNLFRVLCSENVVMSTSNMMFTRNLFDTVGGFRDLRYCHDWDFALRACTQGRVGYTGTPITCYRIHAANTIQEPSPHVDGEAIRLFTRLLTDSPWIEEDSLAVASLRGNRHLGTFFDDNRIGQAWKVDQVPKDDRRRENTAGRIRCLAVLSQEREEHDEVARTIERLRDACDLQLVPVSENTSKDLEDLERIRDEFDPDVVYLCGGFGWPLRNACGIRRLFASRVIVDQHPLRDVEEWCAYHKSKPVNSFDRFIVENDVIAYFLNRQCGIPRNRVDVIHIGFEPSIPVIDVSTERWDGLTFVTPLIAGRSMIDVLDLARRSRDYGLPDMFRLVGPGRPTEECWRYAMAAKLENIRWMANEALGLAALGEADGLIVLSPALRDSAATLALASGKPFFGVAIEDPAELLKQFNSGILIDENSGRDRIWERFVAFRISIESLSKAASEGRSQMPGRYSGSYQKTAYREVFAKAIVQMRGRDLHRAA